MNTNTAPVCHSKLGLEPRRHWILIFIRMTVHRPMQSIEEFFRLKRPARAISREVAEYTSKKLGCYRTDVAHSKALKKRESIGKRPRLKNAIIENYVIEKIKLGYSPEQISIRLPMEKKGSTVSPEAIYQYMYSQIQKGGAKAKKGY